MGLQNNKKFQMTISRSVKSQNIAIQLDLDYKIWTKIHCVE